MPANIRRFVELGLVPALAKEVAAAIDAGTVTAIRARRLTELGMIPREVRELRSQLATPALRINKRWTELGVASRLAAELVAQIGGGGAAILSSNAIVGFIGDSRFQQAIALQAPNYPAPWDLRAVPTHIRQRSLGKINTNWKRVWALSGTTTAQQIANGYHTQAAASDAGTIVVLTGVNNANTTVYTGLPDGGISKYQGEIQTIITTLRAANKVVVLLDELPSTSNSGSLLTAQRDYLRTLHNPAGGVNVSNTWDVAAATPNSLTTKTGYFNPTESAGAGPHPIVTGAIPIAQKVLTTLLPLLPTYQLLDTPGNLLTAPGAQTAATPPTGWSASTATFGVMTHSTYVDGNGDLIWDLTVTGATDTNGAPVTSITGPANTALLAANGGPLVPGTSVIESAAKVSVLDGWSNFRDVFHTMYMIGGTSAKADGNGATFVAGGAGATANNGGDMTDGKDGGTSSQYDYGPTQGASADLVLRTHPATVPVGVTKVQQVFSIYSRLNLTATFTVRLNMSKMRLWSV